MRARVWSLLVAFVAAVMAPVLVAPAALAVEVPPSVREIAERLLFGPVPDGRTAEGEACWFYDGICMPMDTGEVITPGNAIRPAVSAGLAGASRLVEGFKVVGAGCTSNKSVCATLALSSFAALLGIAAGTQEVLELDWEPNPEYEPPQVWGDFPDGWYSIPSAHRDPAAVAVPVRMEVNAGGQKRTVATVTHTASTMKAINILVNYQCRSINGDYSQVLSANVSQGFGTNESEPPVGGTIEVASGWTPLTESFCINGDISWVQWTGSATQTVVSYHAGLATGFEWGALADPGSGGTAPEVTTGGARLECRDSMGSSYYVETSAPAGTWDIPAPKCLDGDIPTGLDVGTRAPGGGLTADTTYDLSPEALRPDTSETGAYPLCAGAACTYAVKVDGKVCGVGDAECVRWTQNPAAQCWYGPYTVDRSACYLLERSYEVQSPAVPATRPNTDGDPTTSSPPAVEELPAPGTTRPAECKSAFFNLGPVQPALVSAVDAIYSAGNQSNISTVYGHRPSDPYPDHPSGIAADFMVRSTAGGHAVANHILANASAYNVKYVLWNQQSWNPSRGTWEPMADRGSDTANHKDHVHLTVNVTDGANACGASPQPTSGEDVDRMNDACFPSGVAAFNPLEWVLRPTKCALAWAFIPGVTFTDGSMSYNVGNYLTEWLEGSRTPFDNSPLGGWKAFLGGVGGSFSAVGASVSCEGPAVPTAMLGEAGVLPPTIYPFRACEGVMATAAATSRMVLTGIIAWGTLWRVTRIIGAPFGYNLEAIGRSGRVS